MRTGKVVFLMTAVLAIAGAAGAETIWQIGDGPGPSGDPISGASEFPATGVYGDSSSWVWDEEFTYVIGTDSDPIGAPTARGYIGTANVCDFVNTARPCTDTAQVEIIEFDLDCGYNNAKLYYARYGSEDDIHRLDGVELPVTGSPPGENNWRLYEFDLDYLQPGHHTISIEYAGSGANDGHYIDFIRLEGERCDCTTVDLCAGQTNDIGEVIVGNDDENLYVTFNITEPGWYLDETHVAVGESLDDIPQTKKGNPIPGQFPFACDDLVAGQTSCTATIPLGEWCEGQPLFIAAHTAVVEVEGDGCKEQIFWANTVDQNDQGTLKSGGDVSADRSVPEAVFALDGDFYSLGLDMDDEDEYADGWLRVGFGAPVYNGPGDDVVMKEVTNGRSSYPLEQVEVFGVDGGMAYSAGIFDNERDVPGGDGFVSLGLPAGPLSFEFIELLDATDPSIHASNADGYDVDAIGACYLVVGDETAWGNGCDRDSEFEGKNWATYFTYTVSSCAPCPSPLKLAAVRFKSFANTGSNEIYLGVGDLGQAANRVEAGYVWSTPGSYEIQFQYIPGLGLKTVYGPSGSPTLTQYFIGDSLPTMDSCEIIVADRDADSQVDFLNVTYDNDGSPVALGDFIGDGTFAAYPFSFDGLNDGFVFEGTIELDDGPFGGDEKSKVEILCGQNLSP